MKKSLLKNLSRALLVLACCLVANNAWADDVYSLVGNNADIFGAAWYTENENTVMSPSSDNVYTWTNPKFPIRSDHWGVQYKVIKNHDYEQGQWPNGNGNNANYTINDPGWYSMTFTFELNYNNVYASVTRLGDVCTVAGATNGEGSANVDDPFFGKTWKADANEMSTNDYTNYIWTSAPVELSSGNSVAFKVVKNNSEWIGNNGNIVCTAEEDGTYLLKVTYSNNGTPSGELIAVPTTTLSNLCQSGVDGKVYTISDANGLLGVYKSGNTVWFKDNNGYATPDVCNSSDNNYEIDLGGGDIWYSKGSFDQSNWIEVVFPSEVNYDGNYVKNLTGTYSYNGGNHKLTVTKAVKDPEDVAVASPAYTPNRYCIANFKGTQDGHYTNNGSQVECTYFFVTPKPQEYAEIILAVYNNGTLSMPENRNGVSGTINVDLSKNGNYEPVDGTLYTGFNVIVNKAVRSSMLKAEGDYVVSPVNLTAADIPTAISTVAVSGEVKSVKYVNVAGVVSDRPFQGVNIVVTEYTDGSCTTAKIVK